MNRTPTEVLIAFDIGFAAARDKVQDYYDESLDLKDLPSATYWNAYLGGMNAAKQLLDRLSRGEI